MSDAETMVLVASDVVSDAEMVRRLVSEEYPRIVVSARPEAWADDFDQHRPQIVILAFKSLGAAGSYYLGMYRHSRLINVLPHRTLLLCHKDELRCAYDLCRKDNFDDYMLFWPLVHDATRLLMSVHLAQRALAGHQATASLAQLAAQARRISELEHLLDQALAQGHAHVEQAGQTLRRTQGQVSAAIDDFSHRLLATGLDDAVKVNDAARVQQQIGQLSVRSVDPPLAEAAQSMQPVQQWMGALKADLAAPLQAVRAMSKQAQLLRRLVLVIDDDAFLRKLLSRVLDAAHYEVDEAANAADAMAALRKRLPDLILMDVQLPDVDGITLTRRLKGAPPVAGIPVIMLTGQREKNVIVDSLAAGAADFVVKPFDKEVLLKKVARFIGA